ncbi:iron complex transport system permease protein [Azospirillum agricola]|nr:iron ABC transporter permease [Azospirillum agricola]MBP2227865.1 iron complex transport system permease protein [Azospirillum agricola]
MSTMSDTLHAAPLPLDERVPYPALVAGLALLAAALGLASVVIGYVPFDLGAAFGDLLDGRATLTALVLAELRLPRAALGLLVGFSLGLTGAAMQGWLRNPLAEPGLVGVSSAAALGAVIVFYSGLSATLALALPLGGMAGAAAAALLLNVMAARGAGTTTLVIGGIAINSLAGSLTALALNLAPNPYAALEIVFWLMGSLADRGTDQLRLVLPPMLAGWALTLSAARALDALTLGEDTARSLGFDLAALRMRLIAGAALAVGSAVSVTGAVGFVGLVAPHLLRPLVGARPGRLLLVSGLAGASLTLAADIAVRLLPTRPELKLGVVTALIGAPFLIALIWRLRREEA